MRGRCAWLFVAAVAVVLPGAARADHSVTELVSVPTNGVNPAAELRSAGVSADGNHILLRTTEQLDPGDTDAQVDVYLRSFVTDTTELVSVGPSGGNGPFDALAHQVDNGGRVIFSTEESLIPEDTDARNDLYERAGNTTTLLSTGPTGGNGSLDDAVYINGNPASTHILFITDEKLTADDTTPGTDLYMRAGGSMSLISIGPTGGGCVNCADYVANAGRVSVSGNRAIFSTDTALTADDMDSAKDIYAREGGTTTLLSTGSTGGNGTFSPFVTGASDDLSAVQFHTREQLVPEDTDDQSDVYLNAGGSTSLVSVGTAFSPVWGFRDHIAEDGSRSWFIAEEQLTADDTDPYPDIYERRSGTTKLISRNTPIHRDFEVFIPGGDPAFVGASADGTRVFFKTENEVTPDDVDPNRCYVAEEDVYRKRCDDIFMYDATTDAISHVSTGPGGGGAYDAERGAEVSDDGRRLLFVTREPLLGQDTLGPGCFGMFDYANGQSEDHGCLDVYERTLGPAPQTYLLSKGVTGGFGPHNATPSVPFVADGVAASVDGRRYYFYSAEQLTPDDADTALDLYVSAVAEEGGYPRPKSASSLQVSLVQAAAACTAPNRTHGPPLAFPSCSPPVPQSPTLTIGAGGTSPFYANSSGLVRLDVAPGAPGGADDSDVAVRVNVTSVWRQSGTRIDYDGELQARIGLRTTDKDGTVPSTIEDRTLAVNVPCTTTPDDSVGSTCAVVTTADAVLPGVVPERTRAVWELEQVRVFDGGPDGDAETPGDNSLFMTQGVFVP